MAKKEGKMPTNKGGKKVAPDVVDTGGHCDGGGSKELSSAAKNINVGNRKGGLPGV